MKTELKAKFLQHISQKKKDGGFTLIELLVVIIIIGILSAIALPSFLNQANKAKQSEAKQYIASINKGQQAYYVENSDFSSSIQALGIGIRTATQNYTYDVDVQDVNGEGAAQSWTADGANGLRAYAGVVYLTAAGDALTSATILCESSTVVGAFAGQAALVDSECNGPFDIAL